MDTTNNIRRAVNELINQGLNIDGVQCYNTHRKLILSDLVTESDIYNNYSYTSCVNWEIKKTPKARPKKLEFHINKIVTGPKKIDFNINVNAIEIDDIINKEVIHLSDDLTDNGYSNIEDHETQHERTNQTIVFILLLIMNYSPALI